jgi:superfamily II DNA/RNA helicase
VLVPTRELAAQVAAVLEPLADARGRSVATSTAARTSLAISGGCALVSTSSWRALGRLGDLVRRDDINLSQVRTVVLDEADRMADMGFLPEVRRLLDRTTHNRQTLLFSDARRRCRCARSSVPTGSGTS